MSFEKICHTEGVQFWSPSFFYRIIPFNLVEILSSALLQWNGIALQATDSNIASLTEDAVLGNPKRCPSTKA